jgi:hypothetical protein
VLIDRIRSMLRRPPGDLADDPALRHQGRHDQRAANASEQLLHEQRDDAEGETGGTRDIQARASSDSDDSKR